MTDEKKRKSSTHTVKAAAAFHMASTAVRYPTPQRVDGSTQRTSVAHGPVRYARPPDLYEIVCALSPIELWYQYELWYHKRMKKENLPPI